MRKYLLLALFLALPAYGAELIGTDDDGDSMILTEAPCASASIVAKMKEGGVVSDPRAAKYKPNNGPVSGTTLCWALHDQPEMHVDICGEGVCVQVDPGVFQPVGSKPRLKEGQKEAGS